MWPICTANSFLWLVIPFVIGLFTGFWTWARKGSALAGGGGRSEFNSVPGGAYEILPARSDLPHREKAAGGTDETAGKSIGPGVSPIPIRKPQRRPESINEALSPRKVDSDLGIPAAIGDSDDLTRIKGIGPKLNALLQGLGVRRFDQIAAWGPYEIAKVDSHLGAFRGRVVRDDWIDQAGLLARGAFDEFEARFGGTATSAD